MTDELRGKVCLITGAGAGIGRAMTAALAERGAAVTAVVRDAARGEAMISELRARTQNPNLELLVCDLASQRQIRAAAAGFKQRHPKLDLLIHQAGLAPSRHTLTEDGVELTLAVNHYAAFLLTELLREPLVRATPSRVIVSTGGLSGIGKIHFDDLDGKRGWKPLRALAQSKLANVLHVQELAERLRPHGVTVNAYDPQASRTDFAKGSGGVMGVMMAIARLIAPPPEVAAADLLHLATSEGIASLTGKYFLKRTEKPFPKSARDPALAARLWEVSAQATGLEAGARN